MCIEFSLTAFPGMKLMAALDSSLRLIEEIQRDTRTILFRGTVGPLARPIRARVPALRQQREFAAIQREHDMLKVLRSERIDPAVGLTESSYGPTLLLPDRPEQMLRALIPENGMTLDQFLPLAVAMAAALVDVHDHEMVHRDIRPASFWVVEEDAGVPMAGPAVRLGNFGRATLVPNEAAQPLAPGSLEGDLRYLSPEQTGRMNRSIDYRSDLYSLGIVFFEMLTGRLPFTAGDPMGWVHCHIARDPQPIRELRPDLPEPLAGIIMRLLSKAAEGRYQLAVSLQSDLSTALAEWRATGRIVGLPPRQSDRPRQLLLPQRLYGREKEVAQLLAAFDRTAGGATELLMVAGHSGIGKSVLVRELQRPLTVRRGYFAEGKFDQLRRDVPFLAMIQPLRDLLRQVLTESSDRLAHWGNRLREVLDGNGGVLSEALPELELVIGRQSPALPLPPMQAQNRFQQTVAGFLSAFATADHPLVLFLDDLQWADVASLRLLESLLSDPEAHHLLVIGAYRDHEVDLSHPLVRTMKLVGQVVRQTVVVPQPLSPDAVHAWLAEAFGAPPDEVEELADLLHRKTAGNPFFLSQLLTTLAATQVARFDPVRGHWVADVNRVERSGLPDDVADLLANRLEILSDSAKHVLRHAACIGNRFELSLLSQICRLPPDTCMEAMTPALRKGYSILIADEGGPGNVYRFAHDRLHRAAYLLTPDSERAQVHLDIGRRMRDDSGMASRYPFEVVRHLNLGSPLLSSDDERWGLTCLNREAAVNARRSAAFDIAHSLFRMAMTLVPASAEPEFRWQLWLDAAEAAYLTQDYAAFQERRGELEAMAVSTLHQAEILELVVMANEARNDFREALDAALRGLALLNVPLSEATAKRDTLLLLPRVAWAVARPQDVIRLATLPDMLNLHQLQVMRLLSSAIRASYSMASPLLPVLSLRGALLSFQHGMTPQSAVCITGCATIFIGVLHRIGIGSRLGELSVRLGDRYSAITYRPNQIVVVQHWTSPLRDMAPQAATAFKPLLADGLYDRAGLCLMAEMTCHTVSRTSLDAELQATQAAIAFSHRRGLKLIEETARNPLALIEQLRAPDTGQPVEIRPYVGTADSRTGEIAYLVRQMFHLLVLGRLDLVRQLAKQVRPSLRSILSSAWVPLFHWYEALALLDGLRDPAAPALDKAGQKAAHRQINADLKLLRLWSRHAPFNNAHRVRLLEAEMAAIDGRLDTGAYQDAVALAMNEGFVADAALAAELFARTLLRLGKRHEAATQIRESWVAWRQWGATAKLDRMRREFPEFIEAMGQPDGADAAEGGQALDVSTVSKVGQAIAGELQLSRLIDRVLDLAMENAGARYAALTLLGPGGQVAAAERRVGETTPATDVDVRRVPPDISCLPEPLLLYVERTLDTMLIEDARVQTRFPAHPRWNHARSVSVLCVPVIHQGHLIGALYLENDLTAGAFTADRVELLRVLASQAAIAIANARLFDEVNRVRGELLEYNRRLEQVVSERTADLAQRSTALEESIASLQATQAQLVQKEKLASLGGLVAGVAHEINTPLGVSLTAVSYIDEQFQQIASLVEQKKLTRTALDSFIADLRPGLQTILLNLKRSVDLVQSFKQVAVDKAGENYEVVNLARHLRNLLPSYELLLRSHGIRLDVALQDSIAVRVQPGVMARILTNLVQNAVAHAFEGIAEPQLTISLQADSGGRATLSITDNGVGMNDDVRVRAFDPFFTTRRGQGRAGLGLHIVHNLVTGSLAGTVRLDTAPGRGCTVILQLPIHAETDRFITGATET
jgi:predicted ATPase/signal transduction histidine kinase